MYLAGILALCAFLPASAPARAAEASQLSTHHSLAHANLGQTQEPQSSDSSSQPKQDSSQPATPDSSSSAPSNTTGPQTSDSPKPAQGSGQAKTSPKAGSAAKPTNGTKKTGNSAGVQTPKKKIVRRGSTGEPTTQLAPGMTTEQAARQRRTTNQLLASTDNALKQISGRQLNDDQQETLTQIRKFMELSKAADKDGDLQRAYKLALKAHLLSDGLTKE